ncbi:MAG: hypothetical protein KGD67_12005, partial [Candidatus Lokiarchaeota archaeon]|nr:hypothetical protein [Candidatus Lokiarchaeota archaeon]
MKVVTTITTTTNDFKKKYPEYDGTPLIYDVGDNSEIGYFLPHFSSYFFEDILRYCDLTDNQINEFDKLLDNYIESTKYDAKLNFKIVEWFGVCKFKEKLLDDTDIKKISQLYNHYNCINFSDLSIFFDGAYD